MLVDSKGFLEIMVPSFRGSGPGSGAGSEPIREPLGTRARGDRERGTGRPCGTALDRSGFPLLGLAAGRGLAVPRPVLLLEPPQRGLLPPHHAAQHVLASLRHGLNFITS